jgi:GNAT superfamily N-acetyltransferase
MRDVPTPRGGRAIAVRPLHPDDVPWVTAILAEHWGNSVIVSPGGARDAAALPGFVAEWGDAPGAAVGLVTYEIVRHGCEVVTLNSFAPGQGVGTALLESVRVAARGAKCGWLWLVTTNDNTPALRFYQRRGWDIVALHRNALAEWRKVKPQIPTVGIGGIPLRHAIELELTLDDEEGAP